MQLKEKKNTMERDKRKLEVEQEKQRQTIGKQVFLQVLQNKQQQQLPQNKTDLSLNKINTESSNDIKSSQKESARRQWDKSQKATLIDMENGGNDPKFTITASTNSLLTTVTNNQINDAVSGGSSSSSNTSSSLSTPSSSASQSPPISSSNVNNANIVGESEPSSAVMNKKVNTNLIESMSVDLSKAYYSRDEVIRAIESLKDKYVRGNYSNNNVNTNGTKNISNNNSNETNNMVKEIEALNMKLSELQNEINRLTLVQKQPEQISNKSSAILSFNLADQRKSLQKSSDNSDKRHQEQQQQEIGAFFISIGDGAAKREKPPTLTPKKNLIFVKSKIRLYETKIILKS
jgi:hypothetical protein